jgi:hypothetical protein
VETPTFGTRIARLIDQRGMDAEELSATGIRMSEFRGVLAGVSPSPRLLRLLDPALGVHAADLFALADLDIPRDTASSGAKIDYQMLDDIVEAARGLTPHQRRHLRRIVASAGQSYDAEPPPPTGGPVASPSGPGKIIMRMLRNRNLDNMSSAVMMYRLADVGPLPMSTIAGVGLGRVTLSERLLSGFAVVLGYPVGDLAALLCMKSPHSVSAVEPVSSEIAQLLWDMRRLSSEQLGSVLGEVKALQTASSPITGQTGKWSSCRKGVGGGRSTG